jgi:methylated-DNA-protein-cysteine methyltransferase related protein
VAGLPGQARLVGYALHNLPDGFDLPWHRVINAQGRISFPKGSRLFDVQRRRLEKEGILFTGDRVSMARFGWP